MAADDQKLEILEEEVKVLKGEVRRTLVDLRALVMREDSPLSESAYGRRAALADMASGDELPAVRRETTQTIRQEAADQPAPAPAPPSAALQQDAARAEQESRFADQERRMAEQERKFDEQERRIAEASRPERGDHQRTDGKDAEQERKIAEQERKIAEQERMLAEASRAGRDDYQRTGDKDPEQERKIAEQERKIAEQEQRLTEASRSERDKDERTRDKEAELQRKIAEQEQNLAEANRSEGDKDERTGDKEAELQRKIAEQEQSLAEASRSESDKDERTRDKEAELQRKIAEQEQRLAEASRSERDEREQTDTKDMEREGMSADEERRPAETSRSGLDRYDQDNRNEESGGRDKYQRAGGDDGETRGAGRDSYDGVEEDDGGKNWSGDDYYNPGEEGAEEQEVPRTPLRLPIPERGNQNPKGSEHRTGGQPEKASIVEHHYYQVTAEEDENRGQPRPGRQRLPQITPHNGSRAELLPDREKEKQYSQDHKERRSPVFDEYFELMKEAEEPYSPMPDAALPPLDLNLVASLVRWASIAKQRVGEQRLSYVLDLYFQSGHSSPSLQALLSHVVEIADEAPPDTDQMSLVCVDLLAHLHGILAGGLPIVTIPEIKVPG